MNPTLEADIISLLQTNSTLTSLLTGGMYAAGSLGVDGINHMTTPSAFTSDGELKPCILVRVRSVIPTYAVLDMLEKRASVDTIVEIYLYDDINAGYSTIDTATSEVYDTLLGSFVGESFELILLNILSRVRDEGSLFRANLTRMDWQISEVY